MARSVYIAIVFMLVTWGVSVAMAMRKEEVVVQPIPFNHEVHSKKVGCAECHFVCEDNRDEDGELDCEDCEEAEGIFCDEHAECPDHRLPDIPNTSYCLRCHLEDLVEIKNGDVDESEMDEADKKSHAAKKALLDYVKIDDADEVESTRQIPWKRITEMNTSNIYFSHRTHSQVEKIECTVCHGDMGTASKPAPHPPIRVTMKWCMDCHRERGATKETASNECNACHR